jgi:class 3 adenylate cyclase/tetratricopeptide (TPR) repeat protein
VICENCGAGADPDARFCSRCGTPLLAGAPPELRRLTILFADLSGFTALTERFDPEDVRTITNQFFNAATEAVHRWGGRVDKFLGDGVMAVFGDRGAREDDAIRAVHAAIELRDSTNRIRPELTGWTGMRLTAHIGVGTGVALTADITSDREASSPLGDAVNVAARLSALAEPDEVLVCGLTHRLVAERFDTGALGQRELKGKRESVEVFRIVAQRAALTERSRAPLVGRDRELALLNDVISTLVTERRGNAVAVVAEAGMGKSSLFAEVRSRHPHVQWLEAEARELEQTTPYGPLVQLLAATAGITPRDTAGTVRAKLTSMVDAVAGSTDGVLGPLARLFGAEDDSEAAVDRQAFQGRLTAATRTLLAATASRRPLVVCIQDLHWADPSTLTLVQQILPELASDVVFLVNWRPRSDQPLEIPLIELADLDEDSLDRMIGAQLGSAPSAELVGFVKRRSGGNPFFAQEVVHELVATGALEPSEHGWRLGSPESGSTIPDTVQGVIAARVDQLPGEARATLRLASVLGGDFSIDEVAALAQSDRAPVRHLERAISDLVRAALIVPVAGQPEDALSRYGFRHALTLDVAYAGLTKGERRRLHRAAARAIESSQSHHRDDLSDVLGRHWQEAGEVEPAVTHLAAAGRKALDRYAVEEAHRIYESAYRMLTDQATAEQRARLLGPLLIGWVLVHYYRGTWRSATDLLEVHAAEIGAAADRDTLGMALGWRGFSEAIAKGNVPRAIELLDEAVAIGERLDNAEVLAHALTWRVWTHFFAGRHGDAAADAERVQSLLPLLDDDRYPRTKSAGGHGLALLGLGAFERAEQLARSMIEDGTATGSSRSVSMGYAVLSLRATLLGDAAAGADLGVRSVTEAADPIYRDFARIMAVHGLVAAGRLSEARHEHDQLVSSCSKLGLEGIVLAVASASGVLQVLEGSLSQGMDDLDDAITRCHRTGNRFLAALGMLYRAAIRARSVTGAGAPATATILTNPRFLLRHALPARRDARTGLESLIEDLPELGGAGLRLLAATELAQLLRHQGQPQEADSVIDRITSEASIRDE